MRTMSKRKILDYFPSDPLSKSLLKLFNNEEDSDFRIIVDRNHIFVHRLILKACSEYFKGLFSQGWKDSTKTEEEIEGFSYNVVYSVLRCVYGGELHNIQDIANDMLIVSDKYGIVDLKKKLIKHITGNIRAKTAAGVLRISTIANAPELKDVAIDFINNNIFGCAYDKEGVVRNEWANLTNNELTEILLAKK